MAGAASAQSFAEALDTPARDWVLEGIGQVVTDGSLAHDGVDAVRLAGGAQAAAGSVSTVITEPSVVTFRHRTEPFNLPAAVVAGTGGWDVKSTPSGLWAEYRIVTLPGTFAIRNAGGVDGGPVLIDEVSIAPLAEVSPDVALDASGFGIVVTAPSTPPGTPGPLGLVSPDAPDGEDALYFPQVHGSRVSATITRPGVFTWRTRPDVDAPSSPPFSPIAETGWPPNLWSGGGRSFICVPEGPTELTLYHGDGRPFREPEALMDRMELLSLIDAAEALDAPGLTFTISEGSGPGFLSVAPVAQAPEGATGGDAVLLLAPPTGTHPVPEPTLSTTVTGPGILTFRALGSTGFRAGSTPVSWGSLPHWVPVSVRIPGGTHEVTWFAGQPNGAWIDEVTVTPEGNADLAAALDNPGGAILFTGPADVEIVSAGDENGTAVHVRTNPHEETYRMNLLSDGPCVVSLARGGNSGVDESVRVNGGPDCSFYTDFGTGWPRFALALPTPGLHTISVASGIYDQWEVIPLEEVPLAEAVDAPEMAFRTSPEAPWTGLKTTPGMNRKGGSAACGGIHAMDFNPWIETDITGPGILTFRMETSARSVGDSVPPVSVTLDGVKVSALMDLDESQSRVRKLSLPSGQHTVRWTQNGSRVTSHAGALVWLDDFSFSTTDDVTLADALETGSRVWATGGTGSVVPLPHESAPDGIDAVFLTGDGTATGWLETVVALPCVVEATTFNVILTTGTGERHESPPDTWRRTWALEGTGTTTLRFERGADGAGVLDQVRIYEPVGAGVGAAMGGGLTWNATFRAPWHPLRESASGEHRILSGGSLTPGVIMWLETTVQGPCGVSLDAVDADVEIRLPDHNEKVILDGWVPYSGPQRLRIRMTNISEMTPKRLSGSVRNAAFFGGFAVTPLVPSGPALGAPQLSWTSGGATAWTGDPALGIVWSGPLSPGEISWLETKVAGPGVLTWNATASGPEKESVRIALDGTAVPISGAARLHVPAGAHTIRWSRWCGDADPEPGPASLELSDFSWVPVPTGNVQEILGAPDLAFAEPVALPDPRPNTIPPWPFGSPWSLAADGGRSALRNDGQTTPSGLLALLPSPGTLSYQNRGDLHQPLPPETGGHPLDAVPFPWSPRSEISPRGGNVEWSARIAPGYVSWWIDDVTFASAQSVEIGEALDQPEWSWTVTATHPHLITAWSGSGITPGDSGDAVLVRAPAIGESISIATTSTGPAVLSWKQNSGVLTNLLINGSPVIRHGGNPSATDELQELSAVIPAGQYEVRWQFEADSAAAAADARIILDEVTLTPADPGPDIPVLVDEPALTWHIANATVHPAAVTRDGIDAIELRGNAAIATLSGLVTNFEGPGVLRFWTATDRSSTANPYPVWLDDARAQPLTSTTLPAGEWREFAIPVSGGTHRLFVQAPVEGVLYVDNVSWIPLPGLTPEEGLDAPPGVSIVTTGSSAAALWDEFSPVGGDVLVLAPGIENQIRISIPAGRTLHLKARTQTGTTSLILEHTDTTISILPQWKEIRLSSADAPTGASIILRGSNNGGPILLDAASFFPSVTETYQQWAALQNLPENAALPHDDADGDSYPNLMEFAFNTPPLDPTNATAQGNFPEVHMLPGTSGAPSPTIRFHGVPGVYYSVEAATSLDGWWTTLDTFPAHNTGPQFWPWSDPEFTYDRMFLRVRVSVQP